MTDYLILFKDQTGTVKYKEVTSPNASCAIHEVNATYGKCEILGVYVKV